MSLILLQGYYCKSREKSRQECNIIIRKMSWGILKNIGTNEYLTQNKETKQKIILLSNVHPKIKPKDLEKNTDKLG